MVDFDNDIKNCVEVLQRGGVILYPTDTVWGLGCDATNEAAVEAVYRIKDRSKGKSLIVLLAEERDVIQYVATPHPDIISIVGQFEVPTTVVYQNALGFPDSLLADDGSIGIRVTKDPFCKALLKRFRKPIVSTSANISGHPTPAIFSMIEDAIKSNVDYVVQYRQQDNTIHNPSRLIKLSDNGDIVVLRS